MAKMTKAQLEQELESMEQQRDSYRDEANNFKKQVNARVEDTDLYKSTVKQWQETDDQLKRAIAQRDRYREKVLQLEDERANWYNQKPVREESSEAEATIDQLRGDNILLKAQNEVLQKQLDELKAKYEAEHIHNARKAGRKQALESDQRKKLVAMRETGHTFEEIGKHFGITKVGALKIYNREKAKETN